MTAAAIRFGAPHHHFESIGSTNLRARELAEGGAPSGTVVTAGEQLTGRGRGGRAWAAPPDTSLLYSAILRPIERPNPMLPLATAIAACEACEALAPVACQIKWPNDIWLEERKLAGILIEARPPEWAIIGVGINLSIPPERFPDDLRWPATSLGSGVEPEAMREALNEALGRWAAAESETVREEFGRRDALAGRTISWEGGPEGAGRAGVAEGIDERGSLRVRGVDDLIVALSSGEVHLRLAESR